jgi:hypothetical protein
MNSSLNQIPDIIQSPRESFEKLYSIGEIQTENEIDILSKLSFDMTNFEIPNFTSVPLGVINGQLLLTKVYYDPNNFEMNFV